MYFYSHILSNNNYCYFETSYETTYMLKNRAKNIAVGTKIFKIREKRFEY